MSGLFDDLFSSKKRFHLYHKRKEGGDMKKTGSWLVILFASILLIPGCYTQFATYEDDRTDEESYTSTEPDTTVDESSRSTIINNYYGDDSYRDWRYRFSFSYYYPSRQAFGIGWSDYYFDDYWFWRDFYGPYYTVVYPYPYWYRPYWYYNTNLWWPYYGGGYSDPYYTSITKNRGERQDPGVTRGNEGGGIGTGRNRETMPPPATTNPGGTVSIPSEPVRSPRIADVEPATAEKPKLKNRDDTPWWERLRRDSQTAAPEKRQQARTDYGATDVRKPTVKNKNDGARQTYRPPESRTEKRVDGESKPAQPVRKNPPESRTPRSNDGPRYTPPPSPPARTETPRSGESSSGSSTRTKRQD
jgi:hypothetical protein